MKYIRTKDGIIYTNCLQLADKNWQVKGKERYIKLNNNHVLKVADTIEELCDEFVFTGDLIINRIFDSMQEIDKWKHLYSKMKITIYGAIWTDKGLIYVAKLNENGELELL